MICRYGADVVVVVTSLYMQENITQCTVIPPAIVNAADGNFPSFSRPKDIIKESYSHSNKLIIVGVSLEGSPLSYKHTKSINHINELQLYKPCEEFTLSPRDVVCEVEKKDSTSGYLAEKIAVGLQKHSDRYFVLSETVESLTAKVRTRKH
ncbi:uncharacterized protein LOC144133824 [Amblyomma americanum]